jgi:hypothetical protein
MLWLALSWRLLVVSGKYENDMGMKEEVKPNFRTPPR